MHRESINRCQPSSMTPPAILPTHIDADLVLDYLQHPDLSEDLAVLCARQSIPMIAPGRKIRYAVTPPT